MKDERKDFLERESREKVERKERNIRLERERVCEKMRRGLPFP